MRSASSSAHLSDIEMAALIEGRSSGRSSGRSIPQLQAHLSDCDECRLLMVESSRAVDAAVTTGRRSYWAWTTGISAIAALLLFAFLPRPQLQFREPHQPSGIERREGSAAANVVRILLPDENSAIPPRQIRFLWHREDKASYRLTVVDRTGDLVWQATTSDSSLILPDSAALKPGTTFYWYVDALRLDGSSITSGRQSFRTLAR